MFIWRFTTKWLTSIPERLPMYLYPLFLVLIEVLLRSLSFLDAQTFIGPTLAAIWASLILPLTIQRSLTPEKLKKMPKTIVKQLITMQQQGMSVQLTSEKRFIQICWTCILVLTLIWVWALYLAIKFPHLFWWNTPSNYIPGFINFFIGFVLSEIREGM